MTHKVQSCVFCNIEPEKYIVEDEHFYAIPDHKPRCKGHTLIISKRHRENYFELDSEDAARMQEIVLKVKKHLDEKYRPKGYRLLMNCGGAAGQIVFHFHLHVLPYY